MSNKIQSTYKPVMDDKEDDLIYIDWCIQNGYLQQALALFSEFIPRVILKSQIISLDNTIFTAKTDVNGHASTKNFNKINELTGPLFEEIKEISDSIINKIIKCFRIYLSNSLRKESHRVRTQLSVNSPIRRELTDFPKLELQLLNEINTIIMEEKEKNL